MKTDDGSNHRRDPADPGEAKVVRLRDWLGPEEELVPIGPRADRPRDSPIAEPETGSGFWEGDASLQTAVPAPEGEPSAPASRGEPVGSARARARRAVPSRRWLAGGLAIAALAAVALMIVPGGGGNARKHGQTEEAAIGGPLAPSLTKTIDRAAAATRAAATRGARAVRVRAERKHRAAARRARARAKAQARARAARARHQRAAAASGSSSSVSAPVQTASTPAYTETVTTAPPPTETEPVQTTPVQTTPAPSPPSGGGGGSSSGGGSNSSSTKTPTYGPTGSLGPGSSPDS